MINGLFFFPEKYLALWAATKGRIHPRHPFQICEGKRPARDWWVACVGGLRSSVVLKDGVADL